MLREAQLIIFEQVLKDLQQKQAGDAAATANAKLAVAGKAYAVHRADYIKATKTYTDAIEAYSSPAETLGATEKIVASFAKVIKIHQEIIATFTTDVTKIETAKKASDVAKASTTAVANSSTDYAKDFSATKEAMVIAKISFVDYEKALTTATTEVTDANFALAKVVKDAYLSVLGTRFTLTTAINQLSFANHIKYAAAMQVAVTDADLVNAMMIQRVIDTVICGAKNEAAIILTRDKACTAIITTDTDTPAEKVADVDLVVVITTAFKAETRVQDLSFELSNHSTTAIQPGLHPGAEEIVAVEHKPLPIEYQSLQLGSEVVGNHVSTDEG